MTFASIHKAAAPTRREGLAQESRPFAVHSGLAAPRGTGHHFARVAVHAPLTPAAEAVQRKKFENDQAAIDWLISAINQGLAAKKVTHAANYTKSKLETYLGKIADNIGEYSALGALMTTYGGVFNAPTDREANINGPLMKPAVQQAAVAAIRAAEVAGHFGVKKRTVTADQQEHIFLGEVNNRENPTTVTGYHSTTIRLRWVSVPLRIPRTNSASIKKEWRRAPSRR